jgi:polyhydroxybutyrate depolymerase
MKNFLLCLSVFLIAHSSIAQLTYDSLEINGVKRTFFKYLPVNYQASENLPVVFILHGIGGNAAQMTSAGFGLIADTARIIAIYPNGLLNQINQTSWNNGTLLSSTADDILFFNQMMELMVTAQNANPSRIYVTGFSMGGIMSHHLACAINGRIAAIGPMAGTMATSDITSCVPVYKTPVIHLHGTADGTVPYNSGALPSLSLVPQTMSFWRNVHGCAATADSTRMPDTAADGFTVDRFVYTTCNPSGSVELWRLNGVDHDYLYEPMNDITEAKEIWRFFRKWQHPNPNFLSVKQLTKEKSFTISPNPSNGEFVIKMDQNARVALFGLQGNLIQSFFMNSGTNLVQLNLATGVYLLKDENGSTERLVIHE